MKIVLIRHGKTSGNLEHRYIGSTDEELCEIGNSHINELRSNGAYPEVKKVFISPMLRCRKTSEIIYPYIKAGVISDMRECDFGEFEGKNYDELKDIESYKKWLDSNGEIPFPCGEGQENFSKRCQLAFEEVINKAIEQEENEIAFIVHGGTIMAIMEKFAYPHKDFYSWQVKNGGGYLINIDKEKWTCEKIFTVEKKIDCGE